MDKRKLKDGSEVDAFEKPIELLVHTKAPAKWLLIDLETGEEYLGSDFAHQTFSEQLRDKIKINKIGSWLKIKDKNNKNTI